MFFDILLAPITGPLAGITWLGSQIQERVNAEWDDKENLSKRLLTLQLAFDMGEVSEEDFEAQEEELLLAIQALEDEAKAAQTED
ncbi:gas vesicle protein GvpG [Trichocoleus sp. FACHB-262]|uniref:gas vesicle protein GvpG n=1 Tax=Trichocoleus sp. FACHB-262 TaxID=2692869 RepID=UPI00168722D9|nr:gas vesicle protein GvpG [Trichocoleus sp. FACHB-262]MBD2119422.1 gas vesicle protein GvpG [Trichocoleus sp. FACHB-262]